MSQVRFENRHGRGGENGKFVLRCGECQRSYYMLDIPSDDQKIYQMQLDMPVVPCHAGGLEIVGEELPFDRVVRLMEGKEPKEGEFAYTITVIDGMICGFSVTRG
jgi:hypothetical protein